MHRRLGIGWVLAVLVLAPLAGCISGDAPTSTTWLSRSTRKRALQHRVGFNGTIHDQHHGEWRREGVPIDRPESTPGTALPIVIAFHGGDDDGGDFQQQAEFDQLAEDEKFIMAYAIAEDDRTAAEGEWFLNTAATSREDNDFAEAIVDELALAYCIDEDRLYAIGYSLGSMFTYEVACQLNHRFAAVASFAGTMPVAPETCELQGNMGVLHLHGNSTTSSTMTMIGSGRTANTKAWGR